MSKNFSSSGQLSQYRVYTMSFEEILKRKQDIFSIIGETTFCFFNQPEWYESWLETCPKNSDRKPIIIVAERNGELVGILALWERQTSLRDLCFRILEPIAGDRSDYQIPIIKHGYEKDVLPLLLDEIQGLREKISFLYWPHIPENNIVASIFRNYFKSRYKLFREVKSICPYMPFGRSYESIEATWPKSLRTDIRRQTKRLQELGDLKLWKAGSKEEVLMKINNFFETFGQKWIAQNKPNALSENNAKLQIIALINKMWGRGLHFSTLQLNGEDISYHLGFEFAGWLMWYKPTYKMFYKNYSPSKVHISYLIKNGISEQLKGIDFLQGNEAYKLQWSNLSNKTTSFFVAINHFSAAYFWFTHFKPMLIHLFAPAYLRIKSLFLK